MALSKICPVCGIDFVDSKHPYKICCSRGCDLKRRSIKGIRNCPGCGIAFEQKSTAQKYCTAACGFKHRPHRPVIKKKQCICEQCGKHFKTWISRPGRFCSRQCSGEYGSKITGDKRRGTFDVSKRVTLYCEYCNSQYTINRAYYDLRGSRFCCSDCRYKAMSFERMGAGNPLYSGGTKFPNRGSNWSKQRKLAFERDGGKCQICGRKARKWEKQIIDVHHIKPYKAFKGDYLAANHLTNLITLCRSCHSKAEQGFIPCPQRLL